MSQRTHLLFQLEISFPSGRTSKLKLNFNQKLLMKKGSWEVNYYLRFQAQTGPHPTLQGPGAAGTIGAQYKS